VAGSPDEAQAGRAARAEAIARGAVETAVRRLGTREFATFRCGCVTDAAPSGRRPPADEAFRLEVNRRLRGHLAAAWPACTFDEVRPDVTVEARDDGGAARVVVSPLYVAGRYRKLSRDLSQTPFHCRVCRGRRSNRCGSCGGSGRHVAESVADFVVGAVRAATGAERASFHGAGREDVDVRMLGRGRPFVVAVADPPRRAFDAAAVAADVAARSSGRVEVSDLRAVTRAEMRRTTTELGEKRYLASVAADEGAAFPDDVAERLAVLAGTVVRQRTPRRVEVRRADLVRERRVLDVRVVGVSAGRLLVELATEAGTYVKELVSGDGGRTAPSLAELLGVPCSCAELDVLDVTSSAS
jgi:tRNA pseudouridine synthase 10